MYYTYAMKIYFKVGVIVFLIAEITYIEAGNKVLLIY